MTSTSTIVRSEAPVALTLQQTLDDYEIHITGSSSHFNTSEIQTGPSNSPSVSNPSSWPRDHHRIPNYRPVNRDLDWSQRPVGSNFGEQVFLHVMFSGVSLNAGMAQLWGATGGKIFTKTFKYAIGGEW